MTFKFLLRKAVVSLKWFIITIFSLTFFYVFIAFILTIIPVNSGFESPEKGITLYLISNGAHVDIAMPVESSGINWEKRIPQEHFDPSKDYTYISFGWGERKFYLETPTWADLKIKTAFHALFLSTESAMHVSMYNWTPAGEGVHPLIVEKENYYKIVDFINKSLEYDENKKAKRINCCNYAGVDDSFYEAKGSYHLFYTCNSWTNECLKEGGVKSATWAPFDFSVLYHHKKD